MGSGSPEQAETQRVSSDWISNHVACCSHIHFMDREGARQRAIHGGTSEGRRLGHAGNRRRLVRSQRPRPRIFVAALAQVSVPTVSRYLNDRVKNRKIYAATAIMRRNRMIMIVRMTLSFVSETSSSSSISSIFR